MCTREREEEMKDKDQVEFNRCCFTVAKDGSEKAVCRDRMYCSICEHCHKHCLEHVGMLKSICDYSQDKKAIL